MIFQHFKLLCLAKDSVGSVPEIRIWPILLIKSDLKWCIHLRRSLFFYYKVFAHVSAKMRAFYISLLLFENYFGIFHFRFAAQACQKNARFSTMASGCPKTCTNPEGEEPCLESPAQGCECKEGYVLSGSECVKPKYCGCESAVGYLKVKNLFLSSCVIPHTVHDFAHILRRIH